MNMIKEVTKVKLWSSLAQKGRKLMIAGLTQKPGIFYRLH